MSGLIFIAGPLNGNGALETIDENITIARMAAERFAGEGVPFFCPHTHSGDFARRVQQSEEFYRKLAISIMRNNAIGMYLLPRWQASEGTQAEYQIALSMRIRIFQPQSLNECIVWFKSKTRGLR